MSPDSDAAGAPDFELIAQISDPHLRVGPGDAEAAAALAAAVRKIGAMRRAPSAVLLSGDIANSGDRREYERAVELLAPLEARVHPLPGNHDDREAMREAFAAHPGVATAGEFLQYEVRTGAVRILVCDTLDTGNTTGGGRFDEARQTWLGERLADDPEAPTIVAMHHPPILTGMRGFDKIGLAAEDHPGLERLLAGAPGVELIVAGHVHRGAVGAIAGRRVITAPSVHLQATLGLGRDPEVQLVHGPPGMLVHIYGPTLGFISHIEPIELDAPQP